MRLLTTCLFIIFSCTYQLQAQTALAKKHKPYHVIKAAPELQSSCEEALTYYPELKNTKIEFVSKPKGKFTMMARPKISSLFKKRSKRTYRVIINTNNDKSNIIAEDLPYAAQVGVFGHELAHIVRYQKQRNIAIIWDGIKYASKKFRARYEKGTDKIAIEHGVGEELHRYASFVLYEAHTTWWFRHYKRKIYLTPEAIEELLLLKPNASVH